MGVELGLFIKGETLAEGVREWCAEGDMWECRGVVTGNWSKVQNEELHDWYH
jgi:hypothetical protein